MIGETILRYKIIEKLGEEIYAVFVIKDKVFAIGGSAPRIVIE